MSQLGSTRISKLILTLWWFNIFVLWAFLGLQLNSNSDYLHDIYINSFIFKIIQFRTILIFSPDFFINNLYRDKTYPRKEFVRKGQATT